MAQAAKKTPHPVDVYVGKRLRFRRKILGLSQDDIGKAVGITFQQIQKYELGKNRMGASRIHQFAEALNVAPDFFFEGFEQWAAENGYEEYAGDGSNKVTGFGEEQMPYLVDDVDFDSKEAMKLVGYYNKIESKKVRKEVRQLIDCLADTDKKKKASNDE